MNAILKWSLIGIGVAAVITIPIIIFRKKKTVDEDISSEKEVDAEVVPEETKPEVKTDNPKTAGVSVKGTSTVDVGLIKPNVTPTPNVPSVPSAPVTPSLPPVIKYYDLSGLSGAQKIELGSALAKNGITGTIQVPVTPSAELKPKYEKALIWANLKAEGDKLVIYKSVAVGRG